MENTLVPKNMSDSSQAGNINTAGDVSNQLLLWQAKMYKVFEVYEFIIPATYFLCWLFSIRRMD
jgi:hypothetical protein